MTLGHDDSTVNIVVVIIIIYYYCCCCCCCCYYHVDDLLQDESECDGERVGLVGDRSLESVVVAVVAEQVVQQAFLVHAANAFYTAQFNQSINQSIFVYYGMTKCRPTTRNKKATQLITKKHVSGADLVGD